MIRRIVGLIAVFTLGVSLFALAPTEEASAQVSPDDYVGIPIMSPSKVTGAQLAAWFKSVPKNVNFVYAAELPPVEVLAQYYIDIGNQMGVRGDFAFVQAIHETGWFSFYGSVVLASDFNFAGIGACNGCAREKVAPYANPTAEAGVRRHLAHLDCYANPNTTYTYCPLTVGSGTKVRGSRPLWSDLNGVWAVPGTTYAQSILANYNKLLAYNGLAPECPTTKPAENDAWGYYMVAPDGGVFGYGDAPFYGSAGALPINQPMIGMAVTGSQNGYWLLARDGGVFSYGDAEFYGSMGATKLNAPVIAMTTTASGRGYWLLAADGGIFSFGDAVFHGSTGDLALNSPVVGMASTPSGNGYWLVAADGGIFSFGDATFYGSTGAMTLNQPVIGMASTPGAAGYHLLASDGGIFTFGDIQFYGSLGSCPGRKSIGMAMTPSGNGYWILTDDGRITTFGDAPYFGYPFNANRKPVAIAVRA